MNNFVKGTALAALLVAGATAAGAATVAFDLTTAGNTYGWTQSFVSGGVTMGVSGYNYTPTAVVGSNVVLTQQIGVAGGTNGLGACSKAKSASDTNCGSGNLIDAQIAPELLKFTFSENVKILSVEWNNNDANDHFDLFTGTPLAFVSSGFTAGPPGRINTFAPALGPLSMFAVGNQTRSDQYRIANIVIETAAVPLPAAGFLLAGAIGGLGALRRKRKAA